jgi:hypothetical protein
MVHFFRWLFVFLDVGPTILFFVFPLFLGCFDLFMIGKFHQRVLIGPFHIIHLAVWPMRMAKYELVTQLIFSFKTIFCNLIEFSMTKTTQNSIFHAPWV